MNELSNQGKWQIWKGVILQIVCILLLMFVGYYMQSHWGMWGLVGTELMFLLVAIGYTIANKTPLKEVFPIKKPRARFLLGTFFIWIGTLMLGLLGVAISGFIFPALMGETMSGLNEVITGGPVIISFLVVAGMPPFCEEAIERGAVLSHFRSLKNKDWLIVLIMGIFFGIFHLDPIRFLTTAALGAALTYVMVKTDNFIYPMLLHFVNNAFSVLLSNISSAINGNEAMDAAMSTMSDFTRGMAVQLMGSYLFIGFLAPILICLGIMFFKEKLPKDADRETRLIHSKKTTRNFVIATILSCVMLASGLLITFTYTMKTPEYQEQYDSMMEQMMEAEEGALLY